MIGAAAIAVTYFTLPEESSVLTATTKSVGMAQTEFGSKVFWVAELDTGGTVRVPITNAITFKKGQRILVIEISSKIGTKKYRLSKILSSNTL